jgi:lytic murein transglycosylase
MQRTLLAAVCSATLLAAGPVAAAAPCHGNVSFERWLDDFKREALAQGVSPSTVASALTGIAFDQGIVNRDRGQGVFAQSFLQFSDRMAAAYRIQKGGALIKKHAATFARIEREFGVPAEPIVAFWGLETDFGANIGNLPTLRSLATLAFDCRRPDKFRPELLDALRVIQRGDLTAQQMIGAWAGELGQMQFMPSTYIKYAVDYDGDGRRDLLHSAPDALASAANFLSKVGWQRGQPWIEEVHVPANLPWDQADLAIEHPRSQWARYGVTLASGRPLPADGLAASLLLPMGRFGPAFLAYRNFKVFLEWNQSLVYSTTVAYLATRIAGAAPVHRGNAPPSLSAQQVFELQKLLAARGLNPGKIDGKAGLDTRVAVKQAQMRLGLPADSWPTAELLERLRR